MDRNKLHYIDFDGSFFSVKGPSITPRPPQGQPIVAALGHGDEAYRLIGGGADVGFVTPHDANGITGIVDAIAAHRTGGRRSSSSPIWWSCSTMPPASRQRGCGDSTRWRTVNTSVKHRYSKAPG